MKKTRTTLFILVVLITTLILGTLPASAKAERYTFEAEQTFVPPPGIPEREWESDGFKHVRNQPAVFIISGDVNGFNYLSTSSKTEIATGDAFLWADVVLDLEWVGPDGTLLSGTFEGKSHGYRVGGTVHYEDTHFVGQGTGGFKGMTMFAVFGKDDAAGIQNVLRGTILVHGNE